MKEYYGVRDLRPDTFPIKSYDEINSECSGMYDCGVQLKTPSEEYFSISSIGNVGASYTNLIVLILVALFIWYVVIPKLK